MRAPTPDPAQLSLFLEVVELRWVADMALDAGPAGWGTIITPPMGKGRRVVDYTRDRKTKWQRRRPVIIPPRQATRGGG